MAKKIGVLFLIFLASYLAAHFYLREKNSQPVEVPRLVDCDANKVRAIRIDTEESGHPVRLEFRRTDKPLPGVPDAAQMDFAEWVYEKPYALEADAEALTRIAKQFCDSYRPTPAAGQDLGPSAGKAKALEVMIVGPAKDETHRLEFGKIAADQMNELVAYVSPAGTRTLTYLSPKLLQLSSLEPKNFVNLHVLSMPVDRIQSLALLNASGRERFTLERDGADWNLSSGGKSMGKGSEETEKFVNRLGTLRALAAEAREPGPCPAKPRKLTLQIHGLNNAQEEISFDYGPTGPLHVCNDAHPLRFEVSRDLLPYLDVNPETAFKKK